MGGGLLSLATLCLCFRPAPSTAASPEQTLSNFLKEHFWIWVAVSNNILNVKRACMLDFRGLCLLGLGHEG